MINIDRKILKSIKEKPCIVEIVSFPDAGSTSACIKLASELVEEDKAAAIFFSEFNTPNSKYINKLVEQSKTKQLLAIQYKADNPYFIPDTIERLAPYVQYFIIDDFYNFILYKNYTFIREFIKRLRNSKTRHGIAICLVNQIRNVIKTKHYDFNTESEVKSLYFEHLETFIDLRIGITKSTDNDIYVKMVGEKKEEKSCGLSSLLSRII